MVGLVDVDPRPGDRLSTRGAGQGGALVRELIPNTSTAVHGSHRLGVRLGRTSAGLDLAAALTAGRIHAGLAEEGARHRLGRRLQAGTCLRQELPFATGTASTSSESRNWNSSTSEASTGLLLGAVLRRRCSLASR